MAAILPILLVSVCISMLFILVNGYLCTQKTPHISPWMKRFCKQDKLNIDGISELGIWMLVALLLLLLGAHCIVHFLMQHSTTILPLSVVVIMNLLLFGSVTAALWCSRERLNRCLTSVTVAAAILFTSEVLICNGKSFSKETTNVLLGVDAISYTESPTIQKGDGELILSGNATLTLNALPEHTQALIPVMSQKQSATAAPFYLRVGIRDDSSATNYQTAAVKYLMAYDVECSVTLHPYGSLSGVQLDFAEISSPVTITGIRAVSAIPFAFSMLRWLCLLIAVSAVIFIRVYRLYAISYQPNRMSHHLAVYAVILLCCGSCLCFFRPQTEAVPYTEGRDYSGADQYIQQFDAFQKGQLALDITAAPELEDLENVYDRETRDASDIPYRWDFAYYEGSYYSYFGVTPIFTLYYPYYFLTGKVPSLPIAMHFYAVPMVFFLCLTILAMLKLLQCRPNLLLLLLSFPTAVAATGIHLAMQWSHSIYYLPVAAGLCFLFMSLWMGMQGCAATGKRSRLLWLAGSGIALVLCAGARPTMAIQAALLLPFFFGILCRKTESLPFRMTQALSFLLPVCAGVGALLVYNTMRFGSPMEFGASYQLTVSDVRANELRLANLPAAIWHYFCQLPRPRNAFPYFEPQYFGLDNYGRYVYNSHQVGALTYPVISLGYLMLPLGKVTKAEQTQGNVTLLQKKMFLVIAAVLPFFIAWFDFCVGGADTRYTLDIMPSLILFALFVLLRANQAPKQYPYILTAAAFALTIIVQFLLLVQMTYGSLAMRCPNLYDTVENLLIFWR